jgi:hypothetical protein
MAYNSPTASAIASSSPALCLGSCPSCCSCRGVVPPPHLFFLEQFCLSTSLLRAWLELRWPNSGVLWWRLPQVRCSTATSCTRSTRPPVQSQLCLRSHTLRSPLPAPGAEAKTRAPSLSPSSSRSTRSHRHCPTLIWPPHRTPSHLPLVSHSSARRYRHWCQSSGRPSRCRRGLDRLPPPRPAELLR